MKWPVLPLQLPASTTNLTIDYPDAVRGVSVKLLDSKVTFQVKDASFLAVLDAVLASANTNCPVECRALKAMKLTLDLKGTATGPLLDALAKAGGARLWVLPTKLLLAPKTLLSDEEKKSAQLYGVLASGTTGDLASRHTEKGASLLDIANTKLAVDFNSSTWRELLTTMKRGGRRGDYGVLAIPSLRAQQGLSDMATIAVSFPETTIGDALAFIAHANGCELYFENDEFLICPPDGIPDGIENQIIPAFSSASTHFNFGPTNLDPSTKGS